MLSSSRLRNAPSLLFQNGEQGVWFDPSDFSTLFQDSAGSTPVTALGQPVGKMLDKSKGLQIGPELAVNGDFGSGSTGWTVTGADGTHVATFSGGTCRYQSGTTSPVLLVTQSAAPLTVGRTYELTVTCSTWVSGAVRFPEINAAAAGTQLVVNGAGTFTSRFTATTTALGFTRHVANVDLTIDSIAVKEIAGNHANQLTAASRPTIEARVNLFDKTAVMTDAVWSFVGGTKTGGYTGIQGAATACVFKGPSTGTPSRIVIVSDTRVTYSVNVKWVSGATSRSFLMRNSTTAINFDGMTLNVQTGAIVSGGTGWTITAGANGWFKLRYTRSTGISVGDGIQLYYGAAGAVPDSGEWAIDEPQVEEGTVATAYQQINTATDYTDIGALRYLRCDGVDDWMSTASIDLTGTDKVSVWAGVKKVSDVSAAILCETSASANTNNGAFLVASPGTAGVANVQVSSRGTALSAAVQTGHSAPKTMTISALLDISAPSISLRVNNGAATVGAATQGTGNYGNYPLYLFRRGGTTLPLNGKCYGLIILGRAATAAEIAQNERWMNSKTRAY